MKSLLVFGLTLLTFSQVVLADTPTSERVSAIIEEVKVTPINGGINPSVRGHRIQGRVMIAPNACVGQNKTIVPEVADEEGITHVRAWRVTDLTRPVAMCPMIYKPVYSTLDLEVRSGQPVVIDNVGEMDKSLRVEELLNSSDDSEGVISGRPAVIEDFSATPINGGFNPDARAFELAGRVLLGTNRCRAQGARADLKIQVAQDGVTHVMAVVQSPARMRLCTMEYAPVYWTFSQRPVRGLQKILVHHVGAMNNNKVL